MPKKKQNITSKAQGVYYLATGIWPVLHIESFMTMTGPKTDVWLVKMVGLLSLSIGLVILLQRTHSRPHLLNILTAMSFLVIDIYYVSSGTISQIYLLDAAIQVIFILLLTVQWIASRGLEIK